MIQNAMMIFNRYYSNYRATNSSHLLNDLGNVDVSNLPRVNPDWLAGFSDGEASFYVMVGRQAKPRVELSFFIKQAKESASALFAIKEFFGKGSIRWDDSQHKYLRYEIRSHDAITSTIIPFFEKHPLGTSKMSLLFRF
jgi:hypothetical protein